MKVTVKSFIVETSGAIAVNFALLITFLLLCLGVAIDYTSMVKERTELQSYADAAVLAAASSGETKKSQLESLAKVVVNAQTTMDPKVNLKFLDADKSILRVTVKSKYKPFIIGMFGYEGLNIKAMSESPLHQNRALNLALVLDTTDSMKGTKLETLKSASSELLNTLSYSAPKNSDAIQVSLVPFSDYVKIDTSNRGQPWLNVQADHQITYTRLDKLNSTNCRQAGLGENTSTECDNAVYEEITATATWHGCMASRKNGYHKRPEYRGNPMPGPASRIGCGYNNNELRQLSSDLKTVNSAIQSFNTKGKTYLPAGLIWGWRTLNPEQPFTEAKSTINTNARNVVLLMTDGSNTTSLNGERPDFDGIYHWGHGNVDQASKEANLLTSELCTSIKNDKIEIITIAFDVVDSATVNLLKNCASSPKHFYNAQGNAGLLSAFQNIGSSLDQIRLSR